MRLCVGVWGCVGVCWCVKVCVGVCQCTMVWICMLPLCWYINVCWCVSVCWYMNVWWCVLVWDGVCWCVSVCAGQYITPWSLLCIEALLLCMSLWVQSWESTVVLCVASWCLGACAVTVTNPPRWSHRVPVLLAYISSLPVSLLLPGSSLLYYTADSYFCNSNDPISKCILFLSQPVWGQSGCLFHPCEDSSLTCLGFRFGRPECVATLCAMRDWMIWCFAS